MKRAISKIGFIAILFLTILPDASGQCLVSNPQSTTSQADPFVTFHEGYYYYTFTTGDHVEVRKSASLEGIASATPVSVWRSWEESSIIGPAWAPELHYLNGKWYIYTTGKVAGTDEMRVIVLEGDRPQDQFTYKGNLAGGIDATILKHPHGGLYMVWMRHEGSSLTNITIAPMTSPTSLGQGWTQISDPNYANWYDWETRHQNCNEGPQIIHRNGKFFLTYSASASWTSEYCLGMFTCDDKADVMDAGVWEKSPEPVFQKSWENGVVGVGHASFTTSPDGKEDWICYHGMDDTDGDGTIEQGWENRHPFIQRISWHADGSPNFGIPNPPDVQIICSGDQGRFVKLRSANFPDQYIRHSASRGRLDSEITPLGDCQFKIVPGLADSKGVSLESVNYPGHFLRHRNSEIWMDPNYGDQLFESDATWYMRSGLSDDKGISFESYNFPGNYIRQRNSELFSENPSGSEADATFMIHETSVNGGLTTGNSLFIEAEHYNAMNGVEIETSTEESRYVGAIDADDWMEYNVIIPVSGTYKVEYRVSTQDSNAEFELKNATESTVYGSMTVASTGNAQSWTTVSHEVQLEAGQQQIAIYALSGGFSVDWINLVSDIPTLAKDDLKSPYTSQNQPRFFLYPNPASEIVLHNLKETAVFSIKDVQGKTRMDGKATPGKGIDISHLSNGIYFVHLQTATATKTIKLVVK
jgi:GH43 family beta-xylosidase